MFKMKIYQLSNNIYFLYPLNYAVTETLGTWQMIPSDTDSSSVMLSTSNIDCTSGVLSFSNSNKLDVTNDRSTFFHCKF